MVRGLVIGKFLPPHLGHSYLIEQALKGCDQLTILVCDRPEYEIPAETRRNWLAELHPQADIRVITDRLDDDDSKGWAEHTRVFLGYAPDKVFTSEDYGDAYAKHLGAVHIPVDKRRCTIPVSGTAVRDDPWHNWQYLSRLVRAYFAKRICILGAESTGTTTLARALAERLDTVWVPEYGRDYTIRNKRRLEREGWKTDDFIRIAKRQNELEDQAARRANKVLICDTDSFATSIWHERYMGGRSWQVEMEAAGRKYDLYLLTDVNIPLEQDGTRDGDEHVREWMHQRFMDKLRFWGKPFVIISGTPEERLEQAAGILERLLHDDAVTIEGLQRNHWHPGSL